MVKDSYSKEELNLVDGEPLDPSQAPIIPKFDGELIPVDIDDLGPPTQEELEKLVKSGETLVEAYAGRVGNIEEDIAYVTLVDKSRQYFQAEFYTSFFHPEEPFIDMFFVTATVKPNLHSSEECITRVQVEKSTAEIPLTEEAIEFIKKKLKEDEERD